MKADWHLSLVNNLTYTPPKESKSYVYSRILWFQRDVLSGFVNVDKAQKVRKEVDGKY